MTIRLLSTILVFGALLAQGPDFRSAICPNTAAPQILMFVPATVTVGGQQTVKNVPLCVAVEADFHIDMSAPNGPTLQVKQKPATTVETETIALDPNIPATQETLSHTLQKLPADGWPLIAILSSASGDTVRIVSPTGANRQQLTLTLPLHRPFTAGDRITLIYWAYE
jgi:hypothetical protein